MAGISNARLWGGLIAAGTLLYWASKRGGESALDQLSFADEASDEWEGVVNEVVAEHWKQSDNAQKFLPYLNAAEQKYGLPHDLLARIAYQESHFREDIISGALRSKAGAIGIMQLMSNYFPGAGADPLHDIETAANLVRSLFARFGDWQLAVAAYNDGGGNVHQFVVGNRALPQETLTYVKDVVADVPIAGRLVA